jgi:outer membrane protein
MKKHILILAVVFLASLAGKPIAQPADTDSLTLEQSVRLTLDNHPLIQQALAGVTASSARIETSKSPYYPDISVAALYTRLDPVAQMDIPGLGIFKFYPENNYDFHLGLQQTIYDFGRTGTSVRLAETSHKGAEDNVDLVKFNLAYQTINVFKAMLILRESIVVLDEQVETLKKHLEMSTEMIRAGTATDFDTLTTQVRIAVARTARIDAARALDEREIALRELTGLPASSPVHVKGTFIDDIIVLDADSAMAIALRQHPELVVSADAESSAAVRADLAALGDKPYLGLAFSTGFKNGYVPDLNKLEANLAAGLQLEIPIFDGHETRSRKKEADANLRSARMRTADIRRQVISEVEQAATGVKTSMEKLRSSEVQVRQAEQALSMARTRYEAGVATNLDVLDAQTSLSEVKLIRLRAFYDYTVSLSALDKATGKKPW